MERGSSDEIICRVLTKSSHFAGELRGAEKNSKVSRRHDISSVLGVLVASKNPGGSFFLLGPRGTGKSWWTRKTFSDALIVDLLEPGTLRELAARSERLGDLVRGEGSCSTVVVDGVQKLPELLEVVHHLIEENCGKVIHLRATRLRRDERVTMKKKILDRGF